VITRLPASSDGSGGGLPPDTDRAAWERRQDTLPVDFHGDVVEPHEVRGVERLLANGERIEWIPREPSTPTNDFVWHSMGGIVAELKSPARPDYLASRRLITDAVVKAKRHDRAKQNFVVDIGDHLLDDELRVKFEGYNIDRSRNQISRLWVLHRGGLEEIWLRNT